MGDFGSRSSRNPESLTSPARTRKIGQRRRKSSKACVRSPKIRNDAPSAISVSPRRRIPTRLNQILVICDDQTCPLQNLHNRAGWIRRSLKWSWSFLELSIRSFLENLSLDPDGLNGTGNAINNMLLGNDLGKLLNGAAGREYVIGNVGNDTLNVGAGFDILEFGAAPG